MVCATATSRRGPKSVAARCGAPSTTTSAAVRRDRAAVVCTAALRPNLAELLRRFGASVEVFAYGEVPPEIELRPASVVDGVGGKAVSATGALSDR